MKKDGGSKERGSLVGLGRPARATESPAEEPQPAGSASHADSGPANVGQADPGAEVAEDSSPWWSRTMVVVSCVALAQLLLLVAWSPHADVGSVFALQSSASDTSDPTAAGRLRPWSWLESQAAGVRGLVAAALAALSIPVAGRIVHELGGGRASQMIEALALLTCPLVLRLGSGWALALALPLVPSLTALTLVRCHRQRSVGSAVALGVAVAVQSLLSPLGWLFGTASIVSLAALSSRLLLAALAPWAILAAPVVVARARGLGELGQWPLSASVMDGSLQPWQSPIGLGLALVVLGALGSLWGSRAPRWQRPLRAVALVALGGAVVLGFRAEGLFAPFLLLASMGAVNVGGQVELRGRVTLAIALNVTLLAGLLTLPLGLPIFG